MVIILLILLGVLFVALFVSRPKFRCFLFHLIQVFYHFPRDVFFYFYHRKYNNAPYGFIDCYCAEFGGGKTLSVSDKILKLYNRFNDVPVYDDRHGQFAIQKIKILSNVALSVPYERLVSLEQFISFCEKQSEIDKENKTLTVCYVFGDEFSVQMNSRNFSKNIDSLLLNDLLTCRHHKGAFLLTSQRFNQMDALLRQVARYVIQCSKSWRFLQHSYFNAWEIENCNNPLAVQPLKKRSVYVTDKVYNSYDTYACVDNLLTDYKNGQFMSPDQIVALQNPTPANDNYRPRKSWLKKLKKSSKL